MRRAAVVARARAEKAVGLVEAQRRHEQAVDAMARAWIEYRAAERKSFEAREALAKEERRTEAKSAAKAFARVESRRRRTMMALAHAEEKEIETLEVLRALERQNDAGGGRR
jgi:hypothetical protein